MYNKIAVKISKKHIRINQYLFIEKDMNRAVATASASDIGDTVYYGDYDIAEILYVDSDNIYILSDKFSLESLSITLSTDRSQCSLIKLIE